MRALLNLPRCRHHVHGVQASCRGSVLLVSKRCMASKGDVFRILAPTAILGYGFPKLSFEKALHEKRFDLIAVDAGSVDPGPYYLATRSSFTALEQVKRDLRIMVEGFLQQAEQGHACKLVVGSAGGCGTDNQVDILATAVQAMLQELGSSRNIATVYSEISRDALQGKALRALGPWVEQGLGEGVVVAQMGLEPIMSALQHADIVLCGRAYDPAVFAAEPVRRGYPAASALHAAKVLECGAIATVPGSGSDCLAAELDMFGTARFWAPNEQRLATPLSVAAHTLYEKSHPHCFGLPSGVLKTRDTTFKQDGRFVEVQGCKLARVPPAVKLEGAAVRGVRAVALQLFDTPDSTHASGCDFMYGRDGVEQRHLEAGEQELGILVSVSGGDLARNKSHLALLRATLLHWGFEGRKATAGNLAFPFSPSDLQAGEEVLTVCGTRDPGFIQNWQTILEDVETYVASLSSPEGLKVRFVTAGLPGMPCLGVSEAVAGCYEKAANTLEERPGVGPPHQGERWVCEGGMAADYTLHHLLDLDEELLARLFPIRLLPGDGSQQRSVNAQLLPWGSGPVTAPEEASKDWWASGKPLGELLVGKSLGELARVVRSKNAGVNEITFDLIFDAEELYIAAKGSPSLDASNVAQLLQRTVLGVYCDDTSLAIKITCAREVLAGSAGDRDVYGAQQHQRLLSLKV
eukprot:TRINITY_DN48220_c0_g1_i1.p1 TRINITY_DN48220_c0_g1~~TRINITY_DN48220_c0_g1_i1.p1  ORF type:complete len:691 (+),score=158.75 TRINITY_DN48220_c0_g1_i1:42-2114(+)